MTATQTARPASPAQIKYLRDLAAKRPSLAAEVDEMIDAGLSMPAASALIDRVVKVRPERPQPKRQPGAAPATVPAGGYAIEDPTGKLRFYRVDRPESGQWKGYTFVAEQVGDRRRKVRDPQERRRTLQAIAAAGLDAARIRYGVELVYCGFHPGPLTDPDSRRRGYGPDCAKNHGLPLKPWND